MPTTLELDGARRTEVSGGGEKFRQPDGVLEKKWRLGLRKFSFKPQGGNIVEPFLLAVLNIHRLYKWFLEAVDTENRQYK